MPVALSLCMYSLLKYTHTHTIFFLTHLRLICIHYGPLPHILQCIFCKKKLIFLHNSIISISVNLTLRQHLICHFYFSLSVNPVMSFIMMIEFIILISYFVSFFLFDFLASFKYYLNLF